MKQLNLTDIFFGLFKGDQGEAEVLTALTKLLKTNSGEENYYLIPKTSLPDINGSAEVDLLLLHPVLGIYAIEVKNWDNIKELKTRQNPFEQANRYQSLLMALLQKHFGKVPINVEYRVIFPSILHQDAKEFLQTFPYYDNYKNHTFFKEHLEDRKIFERFFNATISAIPNKKEFLKIASLLVPVQKLKKNESKIVPIITKDEIVFFDQKQLSIMNGYTGGFRIIRGVAGTGKTVILTNFVANRLNQDPSEKFLILCFNKRLAEAIKESFGESYARKNIAIYSIIAMLNRIGFDDEALGITQETGLEERYVIYESDEALAEFRAKLKAHLQKHPIDYFMCDETQDMPAGFMRILYEEIGDCILFIDEAQRFYGYTMGSIAEVFHHPKFEKINMTGRVKNLKNVYRTPSNIAQCAFEILANDDSLNQYYKKSFYLKEGFLADITCVLASGEIVIKDFDDFNTLLLLALALPKNESNVMLTYTKKTAAAISKMLIQYGRDDIQVMTMQSIKGLEAQNVVIHQFGNFIQRMSQSESEIFYRKIYVLLTRAQQSIYLSIKLDKPTTDEKVRHIVDTLNKYAKIHEQQVESTPKDAQKNSETKLKIAKIKPILRDVRDGTELVVAASQLFAIIGGLFAL